jgi:hypothetical protein
MGICKSHARVTNIETAIVMQDVHRMSEWQGQFIVERVPTTRYRVEVEVTPLADGAGRFNDRRRPYIAYFYTTTEEWKVGQEEYIAASVHKWRSKRGAFIYMVRKCKPPKNLLTSM